jgi:hypothetical protein
LYLAFRTFINPIYPILTTMAKASSSKLPAPSPAKKVSYVASQASESGAEEEEEEEEQEEVEEKSERDSLLGDDTSSADSDELEDVAPRRRENGEASGSGSRRGAMGQLP